MEKKRPKKVAKPLKGVRRVRNGTGLNAQAFKFVQDHFQTQKLVSMPAWKLREVYDESTLTNIYHKDRIEIRARRKARTWWERFWSAVGLWRGPLDLIEVFWRGR